MRSLFQWGEFILHTGRRSRLKIDCNALTIDDWCALGRLALENLPPFGTVEGVPEGARPLAGFLSGHVTPGESRLLIVDDVLTTGSRMEGQRGEREAIGLVVFARGPVPPWVTALLTLSVPEPGVE